MKLHSGTSNTIIEDSIAAHSNSAKDLESLGPFATQPELEIDPRCKRTVKQFANQYHVRHSRNGNPAPTLSNMLKSVHFKAPTQK